MRPSCWACSVATVQSLVEKGEIEAWKTLGGHRRIALQSINAYLAKNNPQLSRADTDPKHRLRVLMVEDDENTRELYRCQFEDWDLPVDCTFMPSALEAMMDIASMRPDLLITDLSMPGVDGIEMLKACKRNLQLSDMQIVVISGLAPEARQGARRPAVGSPSAAEADQFRLAAWLYHGVGDGQSQVAALAVSPHAFHFV